MMVVLEAAHGSMSLASAAIALGRADDDGAESHGDDADMMLIETGQPKIDRIPVDDRSAPLHLAPPRSTSPQLAWTRFVNRVTAAQRRRRGL